MTLTGENVSSDARCNLREKKKEKKKNLGFPGESPPSKGQSENLRHYWLLTIRSIILVRREGEASKVGSARRLPRYTTRAYDVTRPVTRAPCALGHVSCHALVASPLFLIPPFPFVAPHRPVGPLLSHYSFRTHRRSLIYELIMLEMHISRAAALPPA